MSWYYIQSSKRQGPIDDQGMLQMVARGALNPTDLVWRAGMEGWQEAASVPGLLGPPPLPAPAPKEAKVPCLDASPVAFTVPQGSSPKPVPSTALVIGATPLRALLFAPVLGLLMFIPILLVLSVIVRVVPEGHQRGPILALFSAGVPVCLALTGWFFGRKYPGTG